MTITLVKGNHRARQQRNRRKKHPKSHRRKVQTMAQVLMGAIARIVVSNEKGHEK